MNEQELNVNNETLISIKEKLFSGKAAFESNDLEKLCKQFEEEFAQSVVARHAVAVNSCTAALHLAVEALGITDVSLGTFFVLIPVVMMISSIPLLPGGWGLGEIAFAHCTTCGASLFNLARSSRNAGAHLVARVSRIFRA